MKKAKIPDPASPFDEPPMEPRARARTRQEIAEALAALLVDGTPISHACHIEGVPESTYHLWKTEDPGFARVVLRARALAAEDARRELRALVRDGVGTAGTHLHYMARSWPQEYAETKRVELSGPEGGPQKHDVRLSIGDATDGATDGSIPGEDDQ